MRVIYDVRAATRAVLLALRRQVKTGITLLRFFVARLQLCGYRMCLPVSR